MRERNFMNLDTHPEFATRYAEMEKWLHYIAAALAKKYKCPRDEIISYVIIKFNACLYTYDPARGALSTYANFAIAKSAWADLITKESEPAKRREYERRKLKNDSKEGDYRLVATIEEAPELSQISARDEKPSLVHIWDKVKKALSPREYDIIRQAFLENKSNAAIGGDKVTGERIRQVKERALLKLKTVLQGEV